jgi:hypothetical protein
MIALVTWTSTSGRRGRESEEMAWKAAGPPGLAGEGEGVVWTRARARACRKHGYAVCGRAGRDVVAVVQRVRPERLCPHSWTTRSIQPVSSGQRAAGSGQWAAHGASSNMQRARRCHGCQAARQMRALWSCFCEPAYGGPWDWAFGTK